MSQISLAVDIAGLKMRNPTLNAAGVLGMSTSLLERVYTGGAGAVVTKSIGLHPRAGHKNPTIVEVEAGLINAMGLPNPGAEYFADTIRELHSKGIPVVASFFGASIEEFRQVACILSDAGADALELNCSCPNVVEEMGMLGADPVNTEAVTKAVKDVVDLPVIVKLSPNVTDIVSIALAAERGGADALTATNTLKAISVDIDARMPILTNVTGGLSGPALKPVALRCVWDIYKAVDIPVLGSGGISTWKDAVEYLLCGANGLEIGTAVKKSGYDVYGEIAEGIRSYLEMNGFSKVNDIIGLAHRGR